MKRLSLFSNPSRQDFGFYLWRTTPVSDLGRGFLSAARCLSALQRRFFSTIISLNLKGQAFYARPCIMATTSHQRGFVVDDEIDVACSDLANFDSEFLATSSRIRPCRGRLKTHDERSSLSGLHFFGLANAPHVRGVWWRRLLLDHDLVGAFLAGLLHPGNYYPHNDRKLVMVDHGRHYCSVKPDMDRVGSEIVGVCGGGGLTLSCLFSGGEALVEHGFAVVTSGSWLFRSRSLWVSWPWVLLKIILLFGSMP